MTFDAVVFNLNALLGQAIVSLAQNGLVRTKNQQGIFLIDRATQEVPIKNIGKK